MSTVHLNERTSQLVLFEQIKRWAIQKKIDDLVVFESFNIPDHNDLKKTQNVAFFGDFLASYLYFHENRIKDKNIYVLCHKAKEILEALKLETTNKILVIDRYELFPVVENKKTLPDLSTASFDLVYSGRISRSKNILQILYTLIEIQKINPNIGLKLIGEFDDFFNISTELLPIHFTYEKECMDLIEKTSWTKKPIVISGYGSNNWTECLHESDAMIFLSGYWMEDLNVSAAQAQALGFPLIVSDVGGLSDITGDNVLHLPYHLVGQSHFAQDEEMKIAQARGLVRNLLRLKPKAKAKQQNTVKIEVPAFCEIIGNRAYDYYKMPNGRKQFKAFEAIWKSSRHQTYCNLFLQTKEQNHWNSLVRISDQIQKFWVEHQTAECQLEVVDVDKIEIKDVLRNDLSKINLIVAQALGENTIQILKLLRDKLKLANSIIAYPHELPSVFYASLKMRKLQKFFKESDVFVVHCEADVLLTKKSFKQVNVTKIPAAFSDPHAIDCVEPFIAKNIFYIGRVSEQKNLHTLLWSMSLIKDKLEVLGTKLHIYGHHDHFGSPNFGLPGENYLDQLGELIERFDLNDYVEFHGYQSVKHWAKFLADKEGVGIFPGLHVDENFGYAPFDLLRAGVPVILSRWGGFNDHIINFPKHVSAVNVYQGRLGPYINPFDLAQSILDLIGKKTIKLNEEYISRSSWIEKFNNFLSRKVISDEALEFTPVSTKIANSLEYSSTVGLKARGWMLNGRMFNSYSDENFHQAATAYGAKVTQVDNVEAVDLVMAPWVEGNPKSGFTVRDPMKGIISLKGYSDLMQSGYAFKRLYFKN